MELFNSLICYIFVSNLRYRSFNGDEFGFDGNTDV